MRVLVVEDERKLAALLKRGLEENAYAVDVAHDGEEGYEWARSFDYDFIVLDVLLPEKSGIDLCKQLRDEGQDVCIIMLTAKDSFDDRVAGLDAGADDYVVKPFAFRELLARLRALRRRANGQQHPTVLRVGDLALDIRNFTVERNDKEIRLSAKEFALLELLMRHPNQVLKRTAIAEHVWDYSFDNQSNVVDVYIHYLRRKLDDPFDRKLIETVRGFGYRLVDYG